VTQPGPLLQPVSAQVTQCLSVSLRPRPLLSELHISRDVISLTEAAHCFLLHITAQVTEVTSECGRSQGVAPGGPVFFSELLFGRCQLLQFEGESVNRSQMEVKQL
jgi:hypothetical protein